MHRPASHRGKPGGVAYPKTKSPSTASPCRDAPPNPARGGHFWAMWRSWRNNWVVSYACQRRRRPAWPSWRCAMRRHKQRRPASWLLGFLHALASDTWCWLECNDLESLTGVERLAGVIQYLKAGLFENVPDGFQVTIFSTKFLKRTFTCRF